MATLKEAIEYSRNNPQSDFANGLKQRIISGQADEDAAAEGIDLTPFKSKASAIKSNIPVVAPPAPPSVEDSVGVEEIAKTAASFAVAPATTAMKPLGEKGAEVATKVAPKLMERGKKVTDFVEQSGETALNAEERLQELGAPKPLATAGGVALAGAELGGRLAGEAAGGAIDIIGEGISAITPQWLKDLAGKAGEAIMSTPEAQATVQTATDIYNKLPENLKPDVEALVNTISLLGGAKGGAAVAPKVTEAAVAATEKVAGGAAAAAKQVGKTTIETSTKTAAASQEALRSAKDAIATTVYGKDAVKIKTSLKKNYEKLSLPKAIIQEEAQTGKSFADFMADRPNLSMDVKDGKWDTYKTAQALREEVKPEAEALSNLLANRIEMVSQNKIISGIEEAAKKVATGAEQESIVAWAKQEFPILVKQLAEKTAQGLDGDIMISLSDANAIKQALWERSPFKATASRQDNLRSSIDYRMGQVVKKEIEDAVDDLDIKQLNSELGDYYHSISVLENLHGGAAPGGKIGGLFTKLAGTVVGAPGGVVGSIAGYLTAEKISEILMNPAITTALKREALRQLKEKRPTVADRVGELLKKQATESESRLKLPESTTMYMPGTKGGADYHYYMDIIGKKDTLK